MRHILLRMSDDATSLTELLCDYGALWEISRSGRGFTARRRRPPAPPVAFTAPSAAALRPLLEHGYDPAELAAISHMFGSEWHVERVDPGTGWLAVSGGGAPIRVIVAGDLEGLRGKLDRERRPGGR
jgi:hypothetical protein